MKKILAIALAALFLSGCSVPADLEHEPNLYVKSGWYYTHGRVVTDDGHVWDYVHDGFEDDEPVYVIFDNAGTPNSIYDDEIVAIANR